jgi:hypothetical protein
MIEIKTRVADIPCFARLTYFYPGDPGKTWGPPEDCWPSEPAEVAFILLDMQGEPAPWLEDMMDEDDEDRITNKLIDALEDEREYA